MNQLRSNNKVVELWNEICRSLRLTRVRVLGRGEKVLQREVEGEVRRVYEEVRKELMGDSACCHCDFSPHSGWIT